MADTTASLTNYRQAPRKVRLVADVIRGKTAGDALIILANLPKRAADPMQKLLRSAIANAKQKGDSNPETLVVSRISVDKGMVLKRFMPRARGSAAPIRKKSSHVTLALTAKK
jgi:large subunit ribosomal protein L22